MSLGDRWAYDLAMLRDVRTVGDVRWCLKALRATVPVRYTRKEPTEDGGAFRCVHCGRMTASVDGGSDLLPYGCNRCWVRAHVALHEREVK